MLTATALRAGSQPKTCQEILKDYQPRRSVLTQADIPSTPFRHLASLAYKSIPYLMIAITWLVFAVVSPQIDKPAREQVPILPAIQVSLIWAFLALSLCFCAVVFYRASWASKHECSYFEAGFAFATVGIGYEFMRESWYREITVDVIRSARQLDECGELITRLQRVIDTPRDTNFDPLGDNREDILRIIEEARAIHPGLARI